LTIQKAFDYDAAMNGRVLKTTTEVIDALGGNSAVQQLIGAASRQTVSNWRRFKTFPSNTHAVMSAALTAIGKEAPRSLWGQVGPERARARRARNGKRAGRAAKDGSREGARSSA
jgi:hypothetical protein